MLGYAILILFAAFVLLQVADVITTLKNLAQPAGVEYNKALSWLIAKFGAQATLLGVKAVMIAIVALAVWKTWGNILMLFVMAVIVAWYAYAILFNTKKVS